MLIQLRPFVLVLCYLLNILRCQCLVVGVTTLDLWLRHRGWRRRRNGPCSIRPRVARFTHILIWLLELLLLVGRGHIYLLQMLIRECKLVRGDVAMATAGRPIAWLLYIDYLIRRHLLLLLWLAVAVVDLFSKSLFFDIFVIMLTIV